MQDEPSNVKEILKKEELDVENHIEDRLKIFEQKLAQTGIVKMSSALASTVKALHGKPPTYDGLHGSHTINNLRPSLTPMVEPKRTKLRA